MTLDINMLVPYAIALAIGYFLRPMFPNILPGPAPTPTPPPPAPNGLEGLMAKLVELLNRLQMQTAAQPIQHQAEASPVEVQIGTHTLKMGHGGVQVAPTPKK